MRGKSMLRLLVMAIVNAILVFVLYSPELHADPPSPWSDWLTLNDTAKNGISFSWKCENGYCKWRWNNGYIMQTEINYEITFTSAGQKYVTKGKTSLAPGDNESAEYSVIATSLNSANVGVVASEETKARARREQEEANRRSEEQNRVAAEQLRIMEQQRYQQEAEDREFNANLRRQREESQSRLDAAYANAGRSFAGYVNQGMQSYNTSKQMERDANAEIQRRQEERAQQARDAARQAELDRQKQNADLQRQQEANRVAEKQRVAQLEQKRINDEQQRQQAEISRQEQERKEQEERKRKEEEAARNTCTNMTHLVGATIDHPRGAGHCDGEIHAWLTNNSSVAVECALKFKRNGVATGLSFQTTVKPGSKVGGSYGGLYSCGFGDRDDYVYYCVKASEAKENVGCLGSVKF
jgi:hypothetical protein